MNPYLDEDEHRYWDRDTGAELAGVTDTLGRAGIRTDYTGIPDHILEHASARSRAAHLATVYYDDNTLDPASVDQEVQPYLDAWISFRRDTGFVPKHAELLVYSAREYFAGTLDRDRPRPEAGRRRAPSAPRHQRAPISCRSTSARRRPPTRSPTRRWATRRSRCAGAST